jgi:hypothetical protein
MNALEDQNREVGGFWVEEELLVAFERVSSQVLPRIWDVQLKFLPRRQENG